MSKQINVKGLEFYDFALQEEVRVQKDADVTLRVQSVRLNGKIYKWATGTEASLTIDGGTPVTATVVNGTYFDFTVPTAKATGAYNLLVASEGGGLLLTAVLGVYVGDVGGGIPSDYSLSAAVDWTVATTYDVKIDAETYLLETIRLTADLDTAPVAFDIGTPSDPTSILSGASVAVLPDFTKYSLSQAITGGVIRLTVTSAAPQGAGEIVVSGVAL